MNWLKHAFAIEPEGPVQPTERQKMAIGQLCQTIVNRGLSTPALISLEMFRPLHFVGSQAAHFFLPFLAALGSEQSGRDLAEFLEQRGSVDYICQQIEALESARSNGSYRVSQADKDDH